MRFPHLDGPEIERCENCLARLVTPPYTGAEPPQVCPTQCGELTEDDYRRILCQPRDTIEDGMRIVAYAPRGPLMIAPRKMLM
jgi:hypothetical protein